MKNCILLSVLTLATCFLSAQEIEWQKSLGGSNWEIVTSIRLTTDGGYIVAGPSKSTDGDVSGNHGNNDFWIVRLDPLGDIIWTRCFGGSGDDNARDVQQTTDGGFIVAGYSESNNGDVFGNHGGKDVWIVKLNPAGDTLWTKCLGGSNDEEAESVWETSDGGYLIAGNTYSSDGDVFGNNGAKDLWIVKLNSSGDTLWTNCYGGSNSEGAFSVFQNADGGYFVTGYSNSNNGYVYKNQGDMDFWLMELDSIGDTLWTRVLGGSSIDYAYSAIQMKDGNYMVAGFSSSNDGDLTGNHGNSDYWIIKMNKTGDTLWKRCYGGSQNEHARSIIQTRDNNFIIGGVALSTDGDVSGNHGMKDSWIVKIDTLGDTLWTNCYGGSDNDHTKPVIMSTDGGIVVAGYSNSNDGDVSGNHGNNDYWIVKLGFLPEIIHQSDSITICSKQDTSLFITADGSSLSYQWQKNSIDIPGATDSLLVLNNIQTDTAGNYRCITTNTLGADTGDNIILTVLPSFIFIDDTNICQGDSIYLAGAYRTTTGTYYDTLNAGNGCDSVIQTELTVDICSFVKQMPNNSRVAVFPNPFREEITFFTGNNRKYNISIYDLPGNKILERKNITSREYTIKDITLAPGMYMYKITFDQGEISTGIIVEE